VDEDVVAAGAIIEVGDDLYSELSGSVKERGGWHSVMKNVSAPLRKELGMPIGIIPIIKGGSSVSKDQVSLKIRGVPQIPMTISSDSSEMEKGDLLDAFVEQVKDELQLKAGRFVGIDEAQLLVDTVARQRPVLVRETIPKVVKLPLLTDLLGNLVADGISLDHLPEVLEIISRTSSFGNVEDLLQIVRKGLSSTITGKLLKDSERIEAATLGLDVESVLEDSLSTTSRGRTLVLGPDVSTQVVDACRRTFQDVLRPVLIVKSNLRRPLATLLATELSHIAVVSHGEIEPNVGVDIICKIEI
jgi:type III secretory pathway component EscV